MNGCHGTIKSLVDALTVNATNNATNSFDFAIAAVICFTLLVIAIVVICKWFAYKKLEIENAAAAVEKQQNAEIACSMREVENEMRNKLLKALADGPQGLKKEDYNSGDSYLDHRYKEHRTYIKQLCLLLNIPEPADNENKA